MGRKDYIADLQAAGSNPTNLPSTIRDVKPGDDDGSFTFLYKLPGDHSPGVSLSAMVEPSDYPKEHTYFIFTDSTNFPGFLEKVISDPGAFASTRIPVMLQQLATLLQKADSIQNEDEVLPEDDPEVSGSEEFDDDDEEEAFDLGLAPAISPLAYLSRQGRAPNSRLISPREQSSRNARLRQDLNVVRSAGFHVTCIGNIREHEARSYLMVSYRIAHLGIQEDTLKAWNLKDDEYIMLLIHYGNGYRFAEELSEDIGRCRADVSFRVVLSKSFKISTQEAIAIFNKLDVRANQVVKDVGSMNSFSPKTRELFIGRPLNDLINERLITLFRYRKAMATTWQGAENFYNNSRSRPVHGGAAMPEYHAEDSVTTNQRLPATVVADHVNEQLKNHALPLIAMQFMLRHFVRCTEFCLVCHCQVSATFEALRPYVCSKPLCLYQYMALGFGPSIEHEILSQPHVVDLLISFCYRSAAVGTLRYLPSGMGLRVPQPYHSTVNGKVLPGWAHSPNSVSCSPITNENGTGSKKDVEAGKMVEDTVLPKFDASSAELRYPSWYSERPFSVNQWVYIVGATVEGHSRRVLETWWPMIRLGPAVYRTKSLEPERQKKSLSGRQSTSIGAHVKKQEQRATTTQPSNSIDDDGLFPEVWVVPWLENFDDLDKPEQLNSICGLLNLLPRVSDMKAYLKSTSEQTRSLQKWVDRIPPAALGLLRWIIASNRSCIVQVDSLDTKVPPPEDRVSGMSGYMQFRFAQGAPDKEQRFIDAVSTKTLELKQKFPTIFAWHGSPLNNWHGIVREGLHFSVTLHGRAYGHGVYHSLAANVSEGYARPMSFGSRALSDDGHWPGSELNISAALCLNEIVNAPREFVSSNPHLVVAQTDWIQTRYLFVKCGISEELEIRERIPLHVLEQDPSFSPVGNHNDQIIIPLTAISKSRRPTIKTEKSGHNNKKVKISSEEPEDLIYISEDTEDEDVNLLLSDAMEDTIDLDTKPFEPYKPMLPSNITPFIPDSLDHSTLPVLAPPSYASINATHALQRELNNTLKTQDSQPAHELGWYLNPALVGNIYQWIFELHSFDKSIPLARDLTARSLQSIVLELRFGPNFPFSPPFVRIIRPRFLPFLQGGGGHVTTGGALCMELLTNSGWNPASTLEAVLLQVRMAITSLDPTPARLEQGCTTKDYSSEEAVQAYVRACVSHGWEIPKDLTALSQGVQKESIEKAGPSSGGTYF